MRVVLDTNVIISAILSQAGSCSKIVELIILGDLKIVLCPALESEYRLTARKAKLTKAIANANVNPEAFISELTRNADYAAPDDVPSVVDADSEDDEILACALAGRVHTIVTGDMHLLQLRGYEGIEIVSPRTLLSMANEGTF